jgi:Ca2+/Na+ antiporter
MKKYKADIKTIFEVLIFLIISVSLPSLDNPYFAAILLVFGGLYWLFSIYSNIKYKKGDANYILIPSENDDHQKVGSLVLGIVIFTISLGFVFWQKSVSNYSLIGLIVGLAKFISGIIHLPNSKLKIENNIVSLTGLKADLDIRQLEIITINYNTIILTNIYNETSIAQYFNINMNSAEKIENYIITSYKGNESLKIEILI